MSGESSPSSHPESANVLMLRRRYRSSGRRVSVALDHTTRTVSGVRYLHDISLTLENGTLKVLEVVVERGGNKKSLIARFGGIELRWQKGTILDDQPTEVFSVR